MKKLQRIRLRSFTQGLASLAALLALATPCLQAQPFQLIRQWGRFGTGPGQFHYPRGIALNREGHVYVTDEQNGRIQVFDENGVFLFQFGAETSSGVFGPWAIAVGPDENV